MQIAAALIAAAVAQAFPTGRYRCDQAATAEQVGGRAYTWIEVDAADTLLEAALSVDTRDFRATWDVVRDRGLELRRFELSTWAPPAAATYPITVRVIVDGRTAAEQIFARSNVLLYDVDETANTGASSRPWRRRAALDLQPITSMPEIIGSRRIEVDAVEATGISVERRDLTMPNWAAVTAFHINAYQQIGRERAEKHCKQIFNVIAW